MPSRRFDPATGTLHLSGLSEEADLRDPACRRAVLEALRDEPPIEALVLSDLTERRYGPRAAAAVNALLAILRLAEEFATREPAPEFPGEPARRTRARCAACPLQPKSLFLRLAEACAEDLPVFHAELEVRVRAAAKAPPPGCARCVQLTQRDLALLIGRYRDFADSGMVP